MSSTDEGAFPQKDRFPAAQDGPIFELEAMERTLDDLNSAREGVRARLAWSAERSLTWLKVRNERPSHRPRTI